MSKATDLFETITNRLIAEIEAGASGKDWKRPWAVLGSGTPINADGRKYRGLNVLVLGFAAEDHGYTSGVWGTYKQWQGKGAQVRKGERSTQVVLWKPTKRTDENGEEKSSLFATTFNVFAAEQVDGADEVVARLGRNEPLDSAERIAEADAFFASVEGLRVIEGGDRAYYAPLADEVHIPTLAQFDSPADYYSTLAHETVHWSGHESRQARTFGARFGDEAYAFEELVAEIGAAFWCGAHGISQGDVRPDHAKYLAHWVSVLRADSKAIVTAASKAQQAVDFIEKAAAPVEAEVAA